MIKTFLAFALLASVSQAVAAGELVPPNAIASVTVFAEGAQIVRRVPVVLPAGSTTLVIGDLPADIEADSLEIDGSADQPLAITSVETRVSPADLAQDPRRQALADEIQVLGDRLAGIADHVGALEERRRFIGNLARTLPTGFSKALAKDGPGVDQWTAAAQAIAGELTASGDALRQLHVEERGLRSDLQKRQKDLDALPVPRDHTLLRVEVSTTLRASGTLTVSYRVPSAGWMPAYDALLSTGEADGKPSMTIVRRAEVTQATGEDWTNVALTLSTVRPAGGTAAPEIQPSLVSLASRHETDSLSASEGDGVPRAVPATSAAVAGERGDADKPVRLAEATADFGDFHAEYRVPGLVSVASGVGARGLRIGSEEAAAALEVRAVPALSVSSYLHARLTAPAGAPLLAGRVSLFRDGAYVGGGNIGFTNAGARLDLGFGSDDRVKVTRTALVRETGETGILTSRKTDARRFRFTVTNLHSQPISVTVVDRIPYAEAEEITVERLAETTPPTAENVDDHRGVVAWTFTYKPGESRNIENAYRLSWPARESIIVAD